MFSAEWLTLREPYDAAARHPDLLGAVRDWRPGDGLTVMDLGAGTGANFRALAPWLGGEQKWRLIDHDGALLDHAVAATAAWAAVRGMAVETAASGLVLRGPDGTIRLRMIRQDLAQSDALDLVGTDLVTASALLDLVSADWVERLAAACHRAGAAVFATLSYDGRIAWAPTDPDDARVTQAFNRHQRSDKGFGPALGPDGASHLAATLGRCGYAVATGSSDWVLGPADRPLQSALLDGIAAAARATEPQDRPAIDAWAERRAALIGATDATGGSALRIGHIDLFARPFGSDLSAMGSRTARPGP